MKQLIDRARDLYRDLCCPRCGRFHCAYRVHCFKCLDQLLSRAMRIQFADDGDRVVLMSAVPEFGLIAGDMGTVVDDSNDDPLAPPDYRRGVEFDVAPGVIITLVRAGHILDLCDVMVMEEARYL